MGWSWHLVEAELRARGHVTVAPDLPAGDDGLTLADDRDAVLDAGRCGPDRFRTGGSWSGKSFGASTAPLVADRLDATPSCSWRRAVSHPRRVGTEEA